MFYFAAFLFQNHADFSTSADNVFFSPQREQSFIVAFMINFCALLHCQVLLIFNWRENISTSIDSEHLI